MPKEVEKKEQSSGNTLDEPYNPFIHRDLKKPTSDYGALAHLLKTSLGSGILAMPMAFKNAGLLFGAIATIVLGIICTHCVQMLVQCSQTLCVRVRKPTLTYAKTAEWSFLLGPEKLHRFAKAFGIIVSVELIGSFIMGDTVYVIFISETLKQVRHLNKTVGQFGVPWRAMGTATWTPAGFSYEVVEYYWKHSMDLRLYILMLWIPLILMCMFRNLKSLVPFSIIANIFVLGSFGIVLYYIFRDVRSTKSVDLIADFTRLPLFLCTVIFAIEGIGTVLPIENEMKNPEHFLGGKCGILYIAMSIVIAVYGIIGFFGYLQYGEETEGSVTLNLPVDEVMAQVVKILIALAIYITYALQFYVPINLIWDMLKDKLPEKHHLLLNILLRIILVSFTVVISIAIPDLEPFISLVGAICFSSLGLLFPSVIDTVIRWPDVGRFKWRLVKNIIIVIISIIALIAGSYMSIVNIIRTYKN